MTFRERESASGVAPVELVTFARGQGAAARVWRYATGDVPVTYLGLVYHPAALTREAIRLDQSSGRTSVTLSIATATPFVAEWLAPGVVPARGVTSVTIMRVHLTAEGTVDGLGSEPTGARFLSEFSGMEIDGDVTRIACDGIGSRLSRPVPRVPITRTCAWSLFDARCALAPTDLQRTGTIAAVGTAAEPWLGSPTVTITMAGSVPTILPGPIPDLTFLDGGVLNVTISGVLTRFHIEKADLSAWPSVVAVLYDAMPSAAIGTSATLWPGCQKTVAVCRDRFNNVPHFGGFPRLPERNPLIKGLV